MEDCPVTEEAREGGYPHKTPHHERNRKVFTPKPFEGIAGIPGKGGEGGRGGRERERREQKEPLNLPKEQFWGILLGSERLAHVLFRLLHLTVSLFHTPSPSLCPPELLLN